MDWGDCKECRHYGTMDCRGMDCDPMGGINYWTPKEINMEQNTKDTPRYGHPMFYELLDQIADLHSRKNHDYSGTSDPLKNLRSCERLGLEPFKGVLVRLQDKWSRLESFMNQGTYLVKGEGVEDTLMDNAVYSLLAIILYREQKKQEDTPC